jgi:hypothetical protein
MMDVEILSKMEVAEWQNRDFARWTVFPLS